MNKLVSSIVISLWDTNDLNVRLFLIKELLDLSPLLVGLSGVNQYLERGHSSTLFAESGDAFQDMLPVDIISVRLSRHTQVNRL